MLQDTIRANRFKGDLDDTDGLAARYVFTADNIREGRTDANGLRKVYPLHNEILACLMASCAGCTLSLAAFTLLQG